MEPESTSKDLVKLRALARELGHVCFSPAEPGQQERTAAFERLREEVVSRADRVLLFAWRADWARAVPPSVRPAWAGEVDAAPVVTIGERRKAKVLDKGLLQRNAAELAVLKPFVRWREPSARLPASASPGEILLRFPDANAVAEAVRAGCSQAGAWPAVVTRGISNYFSAPTWRMLRLLTAEPTAAEVLVGLPNRTLQCHGSASSIDALIDALVPLLIID
jgi:hypothetical protein